MSFFKQVLTGMLNGHHAGKSRGRHGQGYYNEPTASGQACPNCQQANPAQAKFCGQCGKNLNVGNCTACGQKLTPGSKFCGSCGQAVVVP